MMMGGSGILLQTIPECFGRSQGVNRTPLARLLPRSQHGGEPWILSNPHHWDQWGLGTQPQALLFAQQMQILPLSPLQELCKDLKAFSILLGCVFDGCF